MDKLILNGTNGFPLHTDTLAEAQRAWNIFNAISGITGDLAILQGCEQKGSSVNDGVVVIKGEVLNFKGGAVMPTIIIEEKITERAFKDKNKKPVFATRTAKFGVGSNAYDWDDFQRLPNLKEVDDYINRLFDEKASATKLDDAESKIEVLENKKVQWSEIEQKPEAFPVESHTHPFSDITNLPYKIVAAGYVYCRTRRAIKYMGDFSVSPITLSGRSRADYLDVHRITHNLGHTNYIVMGQALGKYDMRFIKFNAYDNKSNYCDVGTSDDASGNESDFVFAIIEFKN
ncbi:hypothetical protein EDM00_08335 [Ornithobacterium rhinotracheale]|uniref:hypothetical protein n=1 Tax=Ornithobacterium rhinotracheale TaxID=28251 RepID=UPI00129C88D9|nr:hypothetical protein [Ornithobacterium rhinotracheale]MRI63993.1 hypothetical protein [Ornithobacterium rhinotracheale]